MTPSRFLQDRAGGRGLATHGLHLTAGGQHDGGRPGDPADVRAAGHHVHLWPTEGRDHRVRANQLTSSGRLGQSELRETLVRKRLGLVFNF